jgi:hypothetical protein
MFLDINVRKLDKMSFVYLVVCNQGSNKLSHNCLSQDVITLSSVLAFYVCV